MNPSARAALLGLAVLLAAPATAGAATTYTVDPAIGGTACQATTCPTIGSAVAAAAAGDTISILKGTYPESLSVAKSLTLTGAGAGDVKITGSGGGDVLTLGADGIRLAGVTVQSPAGAGSAVVVEGAGAVLEGVVASRPDASGVAQPTVEVTGAAEIVRSFITQNAGSDSAALASTGTGGLVLTDSLALSATGPGLLLAEGTANRIVRSTLASSSKGDEGLRFTAAESAANKKLVMESTFVLGGPEAAALRVVTSGSSAGDVVVDARHVTAFAAKGAVLDASQADGPILPTADPAGNIDAAFTASIVQGPSETIPHDPGPVPLTAANTAKLTFTRSDTSTDPAKLFAPGTLNLRADAPVIDQGGALSPDESDKDAGGEPRVNGAASDIGADEFHNKPPVARFGIANPEAGENEDVGFISGSTDPEQDAGGGIVEYRWDFGDGTRRTTTDLGVVHRYAKAGAYQVTLQVVDRQGGVSPVSDPQTVTIKDRTPPELEILAPTHKQKVKLWRKRGKRPLPLTVLGSWADPAGIEKIEVALRLIKKKKARRKQRASRSATSCVFYSGRLLARKKRCDRPIWVDALVRDSGWALQTRKRLKLPRGKYELLVRGKDGAGNLSTTFSRADKTRVRFKIR